MDMFSLFLAFTAYCQIPLEEIDSILAFMEFLVRNGSRAQALNSYVSVLRHYFRLLDVPYAVLSHRKIHFFIKSISMNSPYLPKFKAKFTVPILLKLVKACDSSPLVSFISPFSSWRTLPFCASPTWPLHLPPNLTPHVISPEGALFLALLGPT